MIEPDINERMARFAPSQNLFDPAQMNEEQLKYLDSLKAAGDTDLKSTMMAARQVNPDQAAKAQSLGSQVGVGADIAMRNMSEVEQRAYMQRLAQMNLSQNDPVLARFLSSKSNAMVAHDDLDTLRETKGLFGDAVAGFRSGEVQTAQSYEAYDLMVGRVQPGSYEWNQAKKRAELSERMMDETGKGFVASGAQIVGAEWKPFIEAQRVGGAAASMAATYALATESVPAPVAAKFGYTAGVIGSLATSSYKRMAGNIYFQMREEGIEEDSARTIAHIAGAVNASIEFVGMIPVVGQAKSAVMRMVTGEVVEQLTKQGLLKIATTAVKESGTTIGVNILEENAQEFVDAAAMSAGQYFSGKQVDLFTAEGWRKQMQAHVDTTIQTFKAMTLLSLPLPTLNAGLRMRGLNKSKQDVARLEKAMNLMAQSRLRKRDPAAAQALIDARTEGVPGTKLYIEAAEVAEVLKQANVDPRALDGLVPGFSRRLGEALASNGDLVMTQGEFLAQLADQDVGRAMLKHVRVGDPEAKSAVQIKQIEQEALRMVEDLRKSAGQFATQTKEYIEQVNAIEDDIIAMAELTGKFTPEQIRTNAALQLSFVVTQAKELKMEPRVFWALFRNQIIGPDAVRAEQQQQAAQFNQQGQRRTDTPEFKAWNERPADQGGMNKLVEPSGEPIRFYHGTQQGGFTAFDPSFLGTGAGYSRGGFSFVNSRERAQAYADRGDIDTRVVNEQIQAVNQILREPGMAERFAAAGLGDGIAYMDGEPMLWDALSDEEVREGLQQYIDAFRQANDADMVARLGDILDMTEPRGVPQVYEVYLYAGQNVREVDATPETIGDVLAGIDVRSQPGGAVIVNMPDGERVVIVSDPRNIKSTDNRGTFSRETADIMAQKPVKHEFRSLLRAWDKYNDPDAEIQTPEDLADTVELLLEDGRAPAELEDVVRRFREDQAYDIEVKGRGEMDTAGNALEEAVQAAAERIRTEIEQSRRLAQQPVTPPPDAGIFDVNNPPAPASPEIARGKGRIVAVMDYDGNVYYDRNARMHGDLLDTFPELEADMIIDGGFISDGKYVPNRSDGGFAAGEAGQEMVQRVRELTKRVNTPTRLAQEPVAQPGPESPGVGVAPENRQGLWPALRVAAPADALQPDRKLILTTTTNANAAQQLANLDAILELFPDAMSSPEMFVRMMAYAFNETETAVPPYAFIRDINGDGSVQLLSTMTQGQIDDAQHGFEVARQFREAYTSGKLSVATTGKLFLWSFLSRGVSPYLQESLFIDAFNGADKWIRMAAEGKFTEAELEEYTEWAKSLAPAGSGLPGAGATHNLNAFGKYFLIKMGAIGPDGKSNLQRLHEMMSDPNQTGRQIRRQFATFGEGVGIDNKVVSFTLLVSGFTDVMVLDRVQIRQLFDDGRFKGTNLYDGENYTKIILPDGTTRQVKQPEGEDDKAFKLRVKEEVNALAKELGVDAESIVTERVKLAGSSLNVITEGVRGILLYEAVERALDAKIGEIYAALGREQDASPGRYHWETWVASSQQEASHGTIEAILLDAKGDDTAIAQVTAKEGEYGAFQYGAKYGRDRNKTPYFQYTTPLGGRYSFSVPAFRAFLAEITTRDAGVVPSKFKVSESKNAPWYTRPEVNQQRLEDAAIKWADLAGGSGAGAELIARAAERADALRTGRSTQLRYESRKEFEEDLTNVLEPIADPAERKRQTAAANVQYVRHNSERGRAGFGYGRKGLRAARQHGVLTGAQVVAEYKPGAQMVRAYKSAGLPAATIEELGTDAASAQAFRDLVLATNAKNKHGAAVYAYSAEEYQGKRLFVTEDGTAGFALSPDGDIVSVFSAQKSGNGRSLMALSVQVGGKKLDCFDTALPGYYAAHGFRAVARLPWNDQYAPAGWDKQTFAKYNNGEPDVVFMVYEPNVYDKYVQGEGATVGSYNDGVAAQSQAMQQQTTVAQMPLEQAAEQAAEQPSEPQGTFDVNKFITTVNASANISTLAHEGAHWWLEVMGRLAARPDASERTKSDFDKILQWFGIEGATAEERLAKWNSMSLAEKEQHHEAFARNWEILLYEGKAPSAELQSVFEKFSRWMKQLYISIRDQFNAQHKAKFGVDLPMMSQEIREVMERVIASDEQIARQKAIRSAMGLFETKPDDMTDAEWEAYQQMQQEADAESVAELRAQSLKAMKWLRRAERGVLRDMQEETNQRRSEMREKVAEEVPLQRVYRAREFLSRGRFVDATGTEEVAEGHRLDIDAVRQMYELEPENLRPDLSKLGTGGYGMMGKGGMNPEVAAEMFGYASADEMIRDLIQAPPVDEAIEAETDRRMLAEYGDMNTKEQREAAVDSALHNELRSRMNAVELRFLSKATQPVRVMVDAARRVARNIIGQRRLRDIRPREYIAAESRAARDAQEAYRNLPNPETVGKAAYTRSMSEQASAIAAGMAMSDAEAIAQQAQQEATQQAKQRIAEYRKKYPSDDPAAIAIAAKRQQLLNHELAREALAARDEVDKAIGKFRRMFKADADIARTRNMDKVMAARAILAAFGLGRSDKPVSAYMEQIRKYDPDMAAELEPIIAAATAGAVDYRDMTLDQFRAMRDAVEALWFNAKRDQEIVIEGQSVRLEAALGELSARLEEMGVPEVVPGERMAPTAAQVAAREIVGLKAHMRTTESWAEAMDAQRPGGPFTKYIWNPVKAAINAYRIDRNKYVKRLVEIISGIDLPVQKIHSDELGYTFGQGNGGIGKAEVLGAMMHMGNESNLRKLLLGRRWGELDADGNLDTSRWDAFVQRMFSEGIITKADMDALQQIWDLNEELKPLAQKAHRQIFGYYFKEVEASPVQTPFGTYRGGYVPAKTDRFMVQEARQQAMMEDLETDFRQSMPSTGFGFTKGRVEYNRPLSLDMRLMASHIDGVLRFAHIQPAIKDVLKLLKNRAFAEILTRVDPTVIEDMLIPWLNRAARQVTSEAGRHPRLDKFWRGVRSRTGIAIMMGNLSNIMQQSTGLMVARVKVKGRYMRGALMDYMKSPFATADMVANMSPFMMERMRGQVFQLQSDLNDLLLNPSRYAKIKDWVAKHGYFGQQAAQNVVDIVAWVGAYNQTIAEVGGMMTREKAHAEAVRRADAVVRLTQSSLLPEDISRYQVGTPFYQTFVQFTSYFNMLANLNLTEYTVIFRDLGWKGNKGRLFATYLFGFAMPMIVADAIAKTMRGQWDDEDEDGYLDEYMDVFFGSQLRGATAMIPFGSAAYTALAGGFTDKTYDDRITSSPSVAALEASTVGLGRTIVAAVDPDKDVSGRNVRDTLTLVSLITGLPLQPLARPFLYEMEVERGNIEPTDMADYIRGLITGTASEASKP